MTHTNTDSITSDKTEGKSRWKGAGDQPHSRQPNQVLKAAAS